MARPGHPVLLVSRISSSCLEDLTCYIKKYFCCVTPSSKHCEFINLTTEHHQCYSFPRSKCEDHRFHINEQKCKLSHSKVMREPRHQTSIHSQMLGDLFYVLIYNCKTISQYTVRIRKVRVSETCLSLYTALKGVYLETYLKSLYFHSFCVVGRNFNEW